LKLCFHACGGKSQTNRVFDHSVRLSNQVCGAHEMHVRARVCLTSGFDWCGAYGVKHLPAWSIDLVKCQFTLVSPPVDLTVFPNRGPTHPRAP